jgi:uncharacterized peroxidase-related enzyme
MFVQTVDEHVDDNEVTAWFEQQRALWGYLPNYAAAFASRPDVACAWSALNSTIREGMDRRRFEIATIAAARALRSTYCAAAHSQFLRDVCGDEATMRAMASDPTGETLSAPDRAVMQFATKVAVDASSIVQADVDELRQQGLTDADVADVIFAVAARSFFTRVLDALGVEADSQLGASFEPDLRERLTVGRPIATEPSR